MEKNITNQHTNHNGSELHRLKPMQENYDKELFDKLYRISKPVIRNLARQIDPSRFNLTPDIIESYFWDKMLFIFNKYYGTCSEDHLQARVLSGLAVFKNHLLHSAYTERATFNQSLHSFEDLFENANKDPNFVDDPIEKQKNEVFDKIYTYMMDKLYPDAQLIFEAIYTPPPFIVDHIGSSNGDRVTNTMLMEFFELPNTSSSNRYIRNLRHDVEYWMGRAKKDLKL